MPPSLSASIVFPQVVMIEMHAQWLSLFHLVACVKCRLRCHKSWHHLLLLYQAWDHNEWEREFRRKCLLFLKYFRIPTLSNLSSSSFICPRAAKGTFPFLNMGWALSFTWNCALFFVHFPRPPENTSGDFCLSSCFNFSMLIVGFSNLRQNGLIGQSQRLNFSIQYVPSVFFSTYALSFFIILFKVTLRTTSPKMFILPPVTECAVFFVLNKDCLFRRRYVFKFIIERSEPESSWNFTVLLKILTIRYLRKFPSSLSLDGVCLILFLGFLNVFGIPTTCYFVANFTTVFTGFILFRWAKPHPVKVTTDITCSWWWIFPSVRTLS